MTDPGELRAAAANFMCMAFACLDEAGEREAIVPLREAIDILMSTSTPRREDAPDDSAGSHTRDRPES